MRRDWQCRPKDFHPQAVNRATTVARAATLCRQWGFAQPRSGAHSATLVTSSLHGSRPASDALRFPTALMPKVIPAMRAMSEILVFVRVVEAGGMAAAARQLQQKTSSISRSVARLEAHLGGRLLHRETRSLALTDLGSTLYGVCATVSRTVGEVEELARRYAMHASRKLRVLAPSLLGHTCLLPLLPKFLEESGGEVDLLIDIQEAALDLSALAFDVAIEVSNNLPGGVIARPLGRSQQILVASATYMQHRPAPGQPEDLAGRVALLPNTAAGGYEVFLRRDSAQRRIPMIHRMSLGSSEAILTAVRCHAGIGLLPSYAARGGLCAGELVHILPEWTVVGFDEPKDIHVVCPPIRPMPEKVRLLIDFLVRQRSSFGPLA